MKRIVLVRPQGPRNVGSILRVVDNFGPAELVLVKPDKPSLLIHPDFEQMSHGVERIVEKIRVDDGLDEALADCTGSYGFTARARDHRALRDWRDAAGELVTRTCSDERIALVFGSEENGLTTGETALLHELVRMPTSSEHGSINLAMTVGIVMSTLFFADAPSAEAEGSTPISGAARRFLVERLKDVFGASAKSGPAKRDIVAAVERSMSLAPLETRDARAWHLLARALDGQKKAPQDYGLPPVIQEGTRNEAD